MWILVLTLVGYTAQSGQAIAPIPKPFSSEGACSFAGSQWVEKIRQAHSSSTPLPVFTCMKVE